AGILRNVLVELISSLSDKQKREGFLKIEDLKIGEGLSDQITLTKSLFETEEELNKGQDIKDKEIKPQKPLSPTITKPKQEIKKQNETPLKTPKSEIPPTTKSERKEKIIEIVKQKGEIMIADLLASFPDVSSKTIQRELATLVEENVLKREGDRRWS